MKWVGLYLALVGIPILGVLGILRLGENLTPPISVGGAWSVEVSPPIAGDPACGNPLIQSLPPVLTISQSGPHLQLTLNDPERTTLAGEIRGETVTAEAVVSGTGNEAHASEDAAPTSLAASVDRQADPSRLRGVLITTRCSLRTEMPFTAVRQPGGGQ
jgi:hypothetical protein